MQAKIKVQKPGELTQVSALLLFFIRWSLNNDTVYFVAEYTVKFEWGFFFGYFRWCDIVIYIYI